MISSTPQTIRVLQSVMKDKNWEQLDLARASGMDRATVSHHINGSRPVRDHHLSGYLTAVPKIDQARLLAAWIHDILSTKPDLIALLFDSETGRLKENVTQWSPELSPQHRQALEWWDMALRTGHEASELFEIFTRREKGNTASSAEQNAGS